MGTYGNDWSELYDIEFKFKGGTYNSRKCDTIITFDIETSNGWRQEDGSVVGFNHFSYKHCPKYRSFIDNGSPVSCMYVWQMSIEDTNDVKTFMGRTWEDFEMFMSKLTLEIRRQSFYGQKSVDRDSENTYASIMKRNVSMICYIHNEGFEYEHLLNVYADEFAKKNTRRKSI